MAAKGICSLNDCDKPVLCGGFCSGHYYRNKRYGDPYGGRTPDGEPLRFLRSLVSASQQDGCIFWPYGSGDDGYGQVRFDGKMCRPSRLICMWVNGDPASPTDQAGHLCGKGHLGCVNPAHLAWRTPLENTQDKRDHGTILARERHPGARLSQTDVREMRALAAEATNAEIGRKYGVSAGHAGRILSGRRWR